MSTPEWYVSDEAFWGIVYTAWNERQSGAYSTTEPKGPWHPTDLAAQITMHIENVAATMVVLGKAGLIDSGHRFDGHHADCPPADVDKGSAGA